MMEKDSPAKELENFLNFVDRCASQHKYAYGLVGEEDGKLQDLLHELEFAPDRTERNKVATRMQKSRRDRRKNKDEALRYELVAKFFEEQKNREVLNQMRQLLGKQRKQEKYLDEKRTYRPRAKGKQDQEPV